MLDADQLLARAMAETGLSDWADEGFAERFGQAVAHINTIPMDNAGRQAAADNIHWLLTDRLRFFEDRKRWPLADEVIDRPMFATGEPRSGTTLMHALMSVDPDALTSEVNGVLHTVVGSKEVTSEARTFRYVWSYSGVSLKLAGFGRVTKDGKGGGEDTSSRTSDNGGEG